MHEEELFSIFFVDYIPIKWDYIPDECTSIHPVDS